MMTYCADCCQEFAEDPSDHDCCEKDEATSASSCSAAELLRAEAETLGGLRFSRPIKDDLRWAYSVAAAFLECKSDPAMIHRRQEIPKQNAES